MIKKLVQEEVLRKEGFVVGPISLKRSQEKEFSRESWVVRKKSYALKPLKVMLSG